MVICVKNGGGFYWFWLPESWLQGQLTGFFLIRLSGCEFDHYWAVVRLGAY